MRRGVTSWIASLFAMWLGVCTLVPGPTLALTGSPAGPEFREAARGCCGAKARRSCTACCCVKSPAPAGRTASLPEPASQAGSDAGTGPMPVRSLVWTLPAPASSSPGSRSGEPAGRPSVPLFTRHCVFLI